MNGPLCLLMYLHANPWTSHTSKKFSSIYFTEMFSWFGSYLAGKPKWFLIKDQFKNILFFSPYFVASPIWVWRNVGTWECSLNLIFLCKIFKKFSDWTIHNSRNQSQSGNTDNLNCQIKWTASFRAALETRKVHQQYGKTPRLLQLCVNSQLLGIFSKQTWLKVLQSW